MTSKMESSINAKVTARLTAALKRLQRQKSGTSIRSLASHLGLTPSYVSKVFRGERRLPLKLLAPIAKVLQLDHHEVAEIQSLLLHDVESREAGAFTGIKTLKPHHDNPLNTEYQPLTDYWLLEEWYHLPLLNLITTENFSVAQMAKRLGITARRAELSLDRLTREGLIKRGPQGEWLRTNLKTRFAAQRSHPSIRAYHRSMIDKASQLLSRAPTESEYAERLISGVTFAGDPAKISEAKLVIEKAMYQAAEILASGPCTEVFQINLQLFKLTKTESI